MSIRRPAPEMPAKRDQARASGAWPQWLTTDWLPAPCPVCQTWCRGGLCLRCLARFAPLSTERCPRCALRVGLVDEVCGRCRLAPPPMVRSLAAVDYDFPWDRLITAWKFHQVLEHTRSLGLPLVRLLQQVPHVLTEVDLLLPVPLAPVRLRERGYNQAWELTRHLARATGLPARHDLLVRSRETAAQSALGADDRAGNLQGAFVVPNREQARLQGLRVALIDDVMTTGATARAASQSLLAAGAAQVQMWVLARTPRTDAAPTDERDPSAAPASAPRRQSPHVPYRPRAAGDSAQHRQCDSPGGQYRLPTASD